MAVTNENLEQCGNTMRILLVFFSLLFPASQALPAPVVFVFSGGGNSPPNEFVDFSSGSFVSATDWSFSGTITIDSAFFGTYTGVNFLPLFDFDITINTSGITDGITTESYDANSNEAAGFSFSVPGNATMVISPSGIVLTEQTDPSGDFGAAAFEFEVTFNPDTPSDSLGTSVTWTGPDNSGSGFIQISDPSEPQGVGGVIKSAGTTTFTQVATAVPEPSGFLCLALVGVSLAACRRYARPF